MTTQRSLMPPLLSPEPGMVLQSLIQERQSTVTFNANSSQKVQNDVIVLTSLVTNIEMTDRFDALLDAEDQSDEDSEEENVVGTSIIISKLQLVQTLIQLQSNPANQKERIHLIIPSLYNNFVYQNGELTSDKDVEIIASPRKNESIPKNGRGNNRTK